MRAGLAKEEYATTWQEENEERGAEDEAHGTFACRCLTEDQRAQDGHLSEASRKTIGEADRQANCEAGRASADTGANRTERASFRWRYGWRRAG